MGLEELRGGTVAGKKVDDPRTMAQIIKERVEQSRDNGDHPDD